MPLKAFYIVNFITIYRGIAAFFLFYLVSNRDLDTFKWMLTFSFFTDALDGFLARVFKVRTELGARLDSIADDLTIVAAVYGIFVFNPGFLNQQRALIAVMLGLYLLQTGMALSRYRRISGFHTYLAKTAAFLQALFLVVFFFVDSPPLFLFYAAAVCTILGLIEEIILVMLIPKWRADVRGLYWIGKEEEKEKQKEKKKEKENE
jgi:phosphatidylglycerophosphate synthase